MADNPAMMPLTLAWWPRPAHGRTLVVMFAYHGRDRDDADWLARLESPAARGHRIVHRDHYANPRSFEYLRAAVASALAHLTRQPADVVIDRKFGRGAEAMADGMVGQIALADPHDPDAWRGEPLSRSRDYDHVVLVYADALGLGCSAAEGRALRGRESVLVLNGRRRAFRLTHGMRRRLMLSRALAHTRVIDRSFGLVIRPVAAALAAWDRWSGRA